MFQRLIDDIRGAAGLAARQTFFVAAVAVSLFVTTAFLCAAAFVFVFERYGLVQACLTGAAVFFVVTLISAGSYALLKRSAKSRTIRDAKSAAQGVKNMMPDPMLLATGLQIARAIGFKKLVPILAIGGLALGILAARNSIRPDDDQGDEADDA